MPREGHDRICILKSAQAAVEKTGGEVGGQTEGHEVRLEVGRPV